MKIRELISQIPVEYWGPILVGTFSFLGTITIILTQTEIGQQLLREFDLTQDYPPPQSLYVEPTPYRYPSVPVVKANEVIDSPLDIDPRDCAYLEAMLNKPVSIAYHTSQGIRDMAPICSPTKVSHEAGGVHVITDPSYTEVVFQTYPYTIPAGCEAAITLSNEPNSVNYFGPFLFIGADGQVIQQFDSDRNQFLITPTQEVATLGFSYMDGGADPTDPALNKIVEINIKQQCQ